MAKMVFDIGNDIVNSEDIEINLTNFALEHCSPHKKEEIGAKTDYSLHFVLYGKGILETTYDEQSVILGSGSVFLLYPNEQYNYRPLREDPWAYMWFAFSGENVDQMMKRCGLTKETPFRNIDDFRKIRALLNEFREEYDKTKHEKLTSISYFLRLITALITTNKEKETPVGGDVSMKSKRLHEILLYIMANYRMDISPETIAQNLHISVGYMNSILSSSLDMSIVSFINALRIAHACELLEQSSLSVEEVANSVGFNDPKYFSRIFSKVKGLSPREYRKSKSKEDPYLWLKAKGIDYH